MEARLLSFGADLRRCSAYCVQTCWLLPAAACAGLFTLLRCAAEAACCRLFPTWPGSSARRSTQHLRTRDCTWLAHGDSSASCTAHCGPGASGLLRQAIYRRSCWLTANERLGSSCGAGPRFPVIGFSSMTRTRMRRSSAPTASSSAAPSTRTGRRPAAAAGLGHHFRASTAPFSG